MEFIKMMTCDNTAVIITDLQKCYCDPKIGIGALMRSWDCEPMQEVCERHIPFVEQLRRLLPPENIIWARMEETVKTISPNVPRSNRPFLDFACRGTIGFEYHLVKPQDEEMEILKTHPSVFHKYARVYFYESSRYKPPPEEKWFIYDPRDPPHYKYKFATYKRNAKSNWNPLQHPEEAWHLDEYLTRKGIRTLILTGVLGSRCINANIIGASTFNYQACYLTDMVAMLGGPDFSREWEEHQRTIKIFHAYFMTSDDLLSVLKTKPSKIKNFFMEPDSPSPPSRLKQGDGPLV